MNVTDRDTLTREDVRALLTERHAHCVSIFLGFQQLGQETPSDGIRMKNLVKDAEEQLVARGLRRPEAAGMLAPAMEVVRETLRWQADGAGLAIFASEDGTQRFRLPHRFDDLVIVNDRFHIEQLVPLLDLEQRFYVLALARQGVRVFEATPHSITQIGIPGMPSSIEEVTQFDTYQNTLRWYSDSGNRPGAASRQQNAMYYGQGGEKDFVKKETEGFFRAVDGALMEAIKLEKAPLVLVALPEELPEYRNVNSYPFLVEQAVAMSPSLMNEDEIHRRTFEIVRPLLERAREDALARFSEYAGTQRASQALEEIVPAAAFGRIDSLMLRRGTHLWGRFDASTGEVETHADREPGDEDLLDVAASYALATRGQVFSVEAERMPEEAVAAAVFRY